MAKSSENLSHLKDALQPYIARHKTWIKSDQYRDWDVERHDKARKYKRLLSRKSIASMTEVEVHELMASLWAFGGWGNKDYLVDRLLGAVDLDRFRELMTELLWGSQTLRKRYDYFEQNVKYLGSAAITEILAFVHPRDCAIWNERARTALEQIELLNDLTSHYSITGKEYEQVCNEFKRILSVLLDEGFELRDLLDVDLFLYRIAIGDKAEDEKTRDYDFHFDHDEVIRKILDVGQYLGFQPEKEVHIAKGAVVDATWTVHIGNLGAVKYVFEVQRRGSVDSLLLNLQRAKRNPAVQKQIVVSNTKGLTKVSEEAETLGEDFVRTLAYIEAADVLKMAKSLEDVWQIINRLELVKPS